jgi:hypothetical protein
VRRVRSSRSPSQRWKEPAITTAPASTDRRDVGRKRGNDEGSIYQRDDGRWTAQITLATGKRTYLCGEARKQVADERQGHRWTVATNGDLYARRAFAGAQPSGEVEYARTQSRTAGAGPTSREADDGAYARSQAHPFLDSVRGDRLEAFYTAALALGLRWEGIDLESGTRWCATRFSRLRQTRAHGAEVGGEQAPRFISQRLSSTHSASAASDSWKSASPPAHHGRSMDWYFQARLGHPSINATPTGYSRRPGSKPGYLQCAFTTSAIALLTCC